MPLVLALKQSDVFNVGVRRFNVDDVTSSKAVRLQEVGGNPYDLIQDTATVVDKDISLQLSERSADRTCRIIVHAPERIPVWRKDRPSRADISLLASVPLVHLVAGLETFAEAGRVAFSSHAFEVFNDLDAKRDHQQVTVYIYPSHSSHIGPPKVRWMANYVQQLQPAGGKHPEAMKYRPASTHNNPAEAVNPVYWEVTDLRQLAPGEEIGMERFLGYGKTKAYLKMFKPQGPLRVEPL